jgi:hypothetical protein
VSGGAAFWQINGGDAALRRPVGAARRPHQKFVLAPEFRIENGAAIL